MTTDGKRYLVEDAGEDAGSGIPAATFPGTLQGLVEALAAGRRFAPGLR